MSAATDLERYRRISTLGSGGMSTVVLAEDTLLGRRVALKRMHQMEDTRGGSRLRREALIGASVSHANLVPIYDIVTEDGGEQVIVMEYVEGETLRDAVRREGRMDPQNALRILEGIAAALDAIHAQGIVHRDVKPANILLGKDGSVKLADLGVASAPDRTAITTTGGVVGTFSYMAPEQLGGERATAGVDVYALAAVAFEALSGRKARTEPNPLALAHAIATGTPPDLREVWPDAPVAAAKLLKRGMSRNPKDRPKSAGELVARLRQALAPEATAAVTPPERKPSAKPAPAPVVSAPPARERSRGAAAPVAVAAAPKKRPRPAPPAPRDADARPAAPSESDARRRRLVLAAAIIPLVIAAATVAAIAASGGSSPRHGSTGGSTPAASTPAHTASTPSHTSSATSHTSSTGSSGASSSTTGAGSGTASSSAPPAAGGAAGAAGSPASAVERFYTLAASHNYRPAWALADPAFQSQLGGYSGFQRTMSATRSITFDSTRTVSQSSGAATVAVRTTSVRTDGTQHCAGTVQLVPGSGGGWLLHQIGINCT